MLHALVTSTSSEEKVNGTTLSLQTLHSSLRWFTGSMRVSVCFSSKRLFLPVLSSVSFG